MLYTLLWHEKKSHWQNEWALFNIDQLKAVPASLCLWCQVEAYASKGSAYQLYVLPVVDFMSSIGRITDERAMNGCFEEWLV